MSNIWGLKHYHFPNSLHGQSREENYKKVVIKDHCLRKNYDDADNDEN